MKIAKNLANDDILIQKENFNQGVYTKANIEAINYIKEQYNNVITKTKAKL